MEARSTRPEAVNQRRAFLKRIVTGFSIVGLGFLTYPFLRHWVPSWKSDGSREVDLSILELGETLSVPWLGREVKILKRSAGQIRALSNPTEPLKDPESKESNQPTSPRTRFAQSATRTLFSMPSVPIWVALSVLDAIRTHRLSAPAIKVISTLQEGLPRDQRPRLILRCRIIDTWPRTRFCCYSLQTKKIRPHD